MSWTNSPPEFKRTPLTAVYDDFDRANTTEPNIGIAPTGGPWTLLGQFGSPPATRGRINNKYVVSSVVGQLGSFYFKIAEIQAPILEMEVTVRWDTAGGSGASPLFGTGLFKTGSPYPAYDAIYSRLYRSSVTLDKFIGGNLSNVQQVALSPDLAAGQDHVLLWQLWPELGRIALSVNGVNKIDVTHSTLKDFMFRNPFFQLSYAASDSTHEGKWKKLVVKSAYGWVNNSPSVIAL